MKIKDIQPRTHKCGCTLKLVDGTRWVISEQCATHATNFQKKADKIIRRKEQKRGRGWTKTPAYKQKQNAHIRRMRQKIM